MQGVGRRAQRYATTPVERQKVLLHAVGEDHAAVIHSRSDLERGIGELAGAHRGAGDTWTPLVAATVGNWLFRVPLALACAIWWETSVVWIWVAIVFDHVSRAAWLTISFARQRWLYRLETP